MPKALSIIRDEHRTISAILHGMRYLVQEIRALRKKNDPRVLRSSRRQDPAASLARPACDRLRRIGTPESL